MSDVLASALEAWKSLCQTLGHTDVGYWLGEHFTPYPDDLETSATWWGAMMIWLPIVMFVIAWLELRSK